jgi:hypothetical protein
MRFGVAAFATLALSSSGLYACPGYIGVEGPKELDAAPEAALDAGGDADPIDAGPRCDPSKPFDPPVLEPGINSGDDEANAWLTPDELTMYLVKGVVGTSSSYDIHRGTRMDRSQPFTGFTPVTEVNSAENEDAMNLTPNGLEAFFASRRPSGTASDIYTARRNVTAEGFSGVTMIFEIDHMLDNLDPYFAGGALYFTSGRNGTDLDVYVSRRTGTAFGPAEPVRAVNGPGGDVQPVLTQDERFIYFSSDRQGGTGFDIYEASRASPSVDFGPPVRLLGVNSVAVDVASWISEDRCVLYLSSDRGEGAGGRDIWRATRPK